MNRKYFLKSFAFCLLLLSQVFLCSAQNEKVSVIKTYIDGVKVSETELPLRMSDIYSKLYSDNILIDSCRYFKQENGYCKLISFAHKNDTLVKFAILADIQNGCALIKSTPSETCTCTGTCSEGCDPEYLEETSEWICTDCKKTQNIIPRCTKSVSSSVGFDDPIKLLKQPAVFSVSEKCVPMENMPAVMSKIYSKVQKKNTVLDVCELVFQEDGQIILVAHGQEDTLNIHFAVPVRCKDRFYEVDEEPETTCTCIGECQRGCNPKHLGGYKWMCTECTYSQSPEPTCIKSVTAKPNPGTIK